MRINLPNLPSGTYRAEIQIGTDGTVTVVPTTEPAFEVPAYIHSIRWRGQVYNLVHFHEMNQRAMPTPFEQAIRTKEQEEKMRAFERGCKEQAIADCAQHDPHPRNRAP